MIPSININGIDPIPYAVFFRNIISSLSSPKALSAAAKPGLVYAPVFIDQKIQDTEITPYLTKNLLNLYGSFIMVVMGLDRYINSVFTVRDVLTKVASLEDIFLETEAIKKRFLTPSFEASSSAITKPVGIIATYATGRLLELELQSIIKGRQSPIKASVFVQLLSRVVKPDFINSLLELSYKDKKHRSIQYSAGEISFWKDFVFGLDHYEKKKKLLSQLNADNASEINTIVSKDEAVFIRVIRGLLRKSRRNVHNNIYIFDEGSFTKTMNKIGLKANKINDIQKILKALCGTILVTVDPLYKYKPVKIYLAGIKHPGEYTHKELMRGDKDKDNMFEMMNIFEMLKQGTL